MPGSPRASRLLAGIVFLIQASLLSCTAAAQGLATTSLDPFPHTVQFVAVDQNVKLEVLDWGGSGRPLVLLAGGGNTAHSFDIFAPKLTSDYHVYGITRRGFGASSGFPLLQPPGNSDYAPDRPDRLGNDVLAVLDALQLDRPVLAGHSAGGVELSSIGSRYPERVAGLIYLDAACFYALLDDGQKFMDLRAPVLAIYADPHDILSANGRRMEINDKAIVDAAADAFQARVPSARVIRIPHADHYVFGSNEADVLREMRAFIQNLR